MADEAEVNRSEPPARPRAATEQPFAVGDDRLTLLPDGQGRLEALIGLIDRAERSLRVLYYIYANDDSGRAMRDALARAAGRGVEVRLIVDGFGSPLPDDFFDPVQAHGGDVCRFLPRYGRRYLLRNHQKLLLADGEDDAAKVIIGGFNIEDDYFDDARGWRDLGLLVEGPAARRLTGYFDALATWTHQHKARLGDLRRALAKWSEPKGGAARWLLGGPTRRLSPWATTVKDDMQRARRLDLIASYFAPNPRMLRRIEGVARRGGEARLVTPAKVDHPAAIAAARHTYARLLRRGVRVFEYQPTKLHTKLFVLDGVTHIGSANFDMRSLYLNLELMLRVEDAGFARHMHDYFDGEIAHSREITRAEHARHGVLDRLRWSAAYFLLAVVDASVTRRLNFGVGPEP